MKAGGLANRFVNRAFSAFDVNRCLCSGGFVQLSFQIRAGVRIEKIPVQKQIEVGRI